MTRMNMKGSIWDIKPRPKTNLEEIAQRLNWLTAFLVKEKGKVIQVNQPHEWAHWDSYMTRVHNLREPYEDFAL